MMISRRARDRERRNPTLFNKAEIFFECRIRFLVLKSLRDNKFRLRTISFFILACVFLSGLEAPKKKIEYEDEDDLDEILKNMKLDQSRQRRGRRGRNTTFEGIIGDIKKQRKKEKTLSWRDRWRSVVMSARIS